MARIAARPTDPSFAFLPHPPPLSVSRKQNPKASPASKPAPSSLQLIPAPLSLSPPLAPPVGFLLPGLTALMCYSTPPTLLTLSLQLWPLVSLETKFVSPTFTAPALILKNQTSWRKSMCCLIRCSVLGSCLGISILSGLPPTDQMIILTRMLLPCSMMPFRDGGP